MEDRREWLKARAAEISDRLGYPATPPVVFTEPAFGPILLTRMKKGEKGILLPLELPQLQVSPDALDNLSEREILYRLTLSLVNEAPGREDNTAGFCAASLIIPVAYLVGMVAAAYCLSWKYLFGLAALPLVLLLPMPIFFLAVDDRSTKNHLTTIEMTGDAVTGIAMLESRTAERPKWVPAILWRPISSWDRRVPAKVKREAERLGYSTEALPDR